MPPSTDPGSHADASDGPGVPAYGPIEAALGYVLFYVIVTRATPTVVEVAGDVLPGLSPSLVRLGLAVLLWFVLVVTVIDQGRRQLVALGLIGGDGREYGVWAQVVPTESRAAGYLVLLLVGGVVAAWTYEGAIDTAVSLVPAVATLDVGAFVSVEFLLLVVFFVAYGVATHAVDRLVIGGVRSLLAG